MNDKQEREDNAAWILLLLLPLAVIVLVSGYLIKSLFIFGQTVLGEGLILYTLFGVKNTLKKVE